MFKSLATLALAVAGAAAKGCNVNVYDSNDCTGELVSYSSHKCSVDQTCGAQTGGSLRLQCFDGCNGNLIVSDNSQCSAGSVYAAGDCVPIAGNTGAHNRVIF
ncbi:hypothetical protein O9K51_01481 [Purpureocillium lavendulum]|uniref:Uncharacterized protein n=1 Tax=Purpureocillium lavendulum TaxID=1247861 RepID=A0AB34G611_9HYPO|nr:hypothetical protein O9K51_01481 [Purpureocillium lavendulum]